MLVFQNLNNIVCSRQLRDLVAESRPRRGRTWSRVAGDDGDDDDDDVDDDADGYEDGGSIEIGDIDDEG